MKNWWIRLGCFLTGYNYAIVRSSSEMSAKAVKKYTAALVIICMIWGFVGYSFTQRYLQGSLISSIIGGALATIIVVQIERQIILSMSKNIGLYAFRIVLGFLMALIGSVIIDQIILKQDIELEKLSYIQKRVNEILPARTTELIKQTKVLDSTIKVKETELNELIEEVSKNPVIKVTSSQTQNVQIPTTLRDSSGNTTTTMILKPSTTVSIGNSPNPKQAVIPSLQTAIDTMRQQKARKDVALLNVQPKLEEEISSKVGFLDELKVMYSLISHSNVAFGFWLLWVLFLLILELLVLVSKLGDKDNDYEKTVLHQMELQIKKLHVLSKLAERN